MNSATRTGQSSGNVAHPHDDPARRADPSSPEAGRSAKAEAEEVARETRQEVAEQMSAARQRAIRQGRELVESQKGRTADQIAVFGAAFREAAGTLDDEGQASAACYVEAVADEVDRAADYLRDREFDQLYHDANGLARRHPEVFLGGMFLAGLAISRFLKASSARQHEESADLSSYSDYPEGEEPAAPYGEAYYEDELAQDQLSKPAGPSPMAGGAGAAMPSPTGDRAASEAAHEGPEDASSPEPGKPR